MTYKVGFGLANDDTLCISILGSDTRGTIKQSLVSLDVAFSLRQEFKVKKSHFLGLRFSYDLNVVAPYAVSEVDNPK